MPDEKQVVIETDGQVIVDEKGRSMAVLEFNAEEPTDEKGIEG